MNNDFLGTGWTFPPEFIKSGKNGVVTTSGVDDINESLEILLTTTVGERLLQLEYGSDLTEYVFEPLTATLKAVVETRVRKAIQLYEPRIRLNKLELIPDNLEGRLLIKLTYTVVTTNTRFNLVLPFYLNEANNVS